MPLVWSYIRRWARGWTFRSHKHQGRKRSPTLPVCHLLQVVAAIFAPSRSQSRARSRVSTLRSFESPRSFQDLKCGRGRREDSTGVRLVVHSRCAEEEAQSRRASEALLFFVLLNGRTPNQPLR